MPQKVALGKLLSQPCLCGAKCCFTQFGEHGEEVHAERQRFHRLDEARRETCKLVSLKLFLCNLFSSIYL